MSDSDFKHIYFNDWIIGESYEHRDKKLFDFKTDIEISLNLAALVPLDYVLVSESGITDIADIILLKDAGINCFLIGEHFMRQQHIATAVKAFL